MNIFNNSKYRIPVAVLVVSIIFLLILIHSYFLIDKKYNSGVVIFFILLFVITFGINLRRIYTRLREQERQLSSMIGNLPGFVYRCKYDIHWTILYASDQCFGITGYKPEELINNSTKAYSGIIASEYLDYVDDETDLAIEKKTPFVMEYEIITANNQRKWVLERGKGIYDNKGELIFLEGYIEDISERKARESEIRESAEDYSRLLNGMNETIWLIDFEGNLVDVNNASMQTLGYTKEELLTLGITGIEHNFRQSEFSEMFLLNKEEQSSVFETCHYAKDGRKIPVEICSSIVKYKGSRVILAIARDITVRKELEEQRRIQEDVKSELLETVTAAKLKAEESERLKMAFLANMSHEIRTPMNGILGFMELLKEPDLEESSRREYIDLVNVSGERLLSTINDIIEISKIESGEQQLKLEPVDLDEVIQFYLDFFKRETDAKGIALQINSRLTGKQALVLSDRHKLDGILTNLIKNAIKFTREGSIEIGNYISDESIVFFVKDTGKGIPADRHQAIFERFVQAENSFARTHEGSGLGLAIAKAYVESLNGRIWVVSEPGHGSNFRFIIPFLPAEKTDKQVLVNISEIKKTATGLNILVAEDDEISYKIMEKLLRNEPVKLTRARNGKEAVQLAKENNHFSLILMDINMPLLDGLDATREIRQFNTSIPIIAQTAYALNGDREKTRDAGCTGYISKPIKRQELLKVIGKYTN
jgi:PAS domain S-box-containing protein